MNDNINNNNDFVFILNTNKSLDWFDQNGHWIHGTLSITLNHIHIIVKFLFFDYIK